MNIGLILLLGSFLVGADKENSEKPTEQPKSNNEKITLNEMVVSKNNQDDLSEIKSNNKEPIQNKNISPSFVNRNPSLRGEPKTTIKQDEHYSFMVQASDPENDKLSFVISNKPNWAIFDTRTGALFGQPNNFDIGISKNIIISVLDQFGGKSSLMPFNIEVINVNDKPTISGIPSTIFILGKTYKFTPKAKDMDVDIGKDKLKFSIKNKTKWAQFNQYTGELIGIPKGIISDSEEIVITVTDSMGESDSTSPFYIRALSPENSLTDEASSPSVAKNIESLSTQNNSGQLNISSSLNQKDNVDTSAYKTPEDSPNDFDVASTSDSKVDTDNNGDPTDDSSRQTETEQTDIDSLDSNKGKDQDTAVPVNELQEPKDPVKDNEQTSVMVDQSDANPPKTETDKNDSDIGKDQDEAVPVNKLQDPKDPVKDNEQDSGDEADQSDANPPKTKTDKNDSDTLDSIKKKDQGAAVPVNEVQQPKDPVRDNEQASSDDSDLSKDNTPEQDSNTLDSNKKKDQEEAVPFNEAQQPKDPVRDNEQASSDEADQSDANPPTTETDKNDSDTLDSNKGKDQEDAVPVNELEEPKDLVEDNEQDFVDEADQSDANPPITETDKNNTTWVDVCWQFSETTANLDSTKITEIKKEIMNTISDSWEKNSALMFDWREDDWDAMQNGKGQLFKWDSPSNCAENYTAEYAQVKVYIKQKEEVESKQAENRFTINLNVKADGSFVDAYPKHRIIHEFGHALGFPDENKRFDIFTGDLTKKSIESWHSWECVKSMNIQKPSIAKENDLISTMAVMEISYKEWQQQPYDSYSIMDECIFDNPSAYENSASNLQTDMLTINDKKRVQQFYGAPIIETESPHLINDDQFFTGLFLHGNDYFYYGNGVKSSNDRFINTRTVKMFFDTGGIYISALSSDINEDVLFKKTYDGDSPPSFISPFPSLLITCPEGQDDSNGFRYRHAGKCKSPDNLIADNESVYYFYDDPQSIKFYSCATDSNNSSKTNNCSEINNSWLVSDGVLFAKGIKNNATYLYKKY